MSILLRWWICIFLMNSLWRYLCFFLMFVLHKHLSDKDFCTHTSQGLVYQPHCPERLKRRQGKYLPLSNLYCWGTLSFQPHLWEVIALEKAQKWAMYNLVVFEAPLKSRGQLFGQLQLSCFHFCVHSFAPHAKRSSLILQSYGNCVLFLVSSCFRFCEA